MFLKGKSSKGMRRRVVPAAMPGLFDAIDVSPVEVAAKPTRVIDAAIPAPLTRTEAAIAIAQGVPRPEPAKVWTVGELVREVRGVVETRYRRVTVEGEISNWRPAGSGHCYFTLKDGAAQLSAVMFRREAGLLRVKPKDGDAVRLRGQVSVYESRGQMQLIAEGMELAGLGAQLAAVQELKARLKREGVFANERALPPFPRCIGVVTSLQGAALRDIVKVCKRRHAAVNLLVYPAAVQGPRCAVEVAAGVRWFSARSAEPGQRGGVDVVLVARGGGSWEDLHGFDDERVARAIAACSVPVIAGIGHATDTTIADGAADVCAPTPSAAAELLTATQHGVELRVERLAARLERAGRYELLRVRQRVSAVGAEAVLRRVRDALRRREQRLDELQFRMQAAQLRTAARLAARLAGVENRLRQQDVKWHLAVSVRRLEGLRGRLERAGALVVRGKDERVARLVARADALSPLRVLERGYALVFGPGGRLLRASSEVRAGDAVTARLADGSVRAVVTASD